VGLLISSDAAYPGVSTLRLSGEIDLSTVEQLREAITREIERGEVAAVLIDLDGVTFLDSTGIGALVQGRGLASRHGKRLGVANAHGLVRRVLEATGTWQYLTGSESA
jgi:anti-anti-sigma factor